ncbi:MAG: IclR family transcriptional regulator [Alphaproteobacteria bacterium]|nr:IclR family transcriptional regulator [Alphaproteobacteria bacterium]
MIDRVFNVVELLADFPEGIPISDVARRLKTSKSEAHRLLSIFIKRGYAVQDEVSKRYRLAIRFAVIGHRFFGKAGLIDLCQPVLDRLAARTAELARLAVVESGSMIFVANAQGASTGVRYDEELGRIITAPQATANGRVWLATMPTEDAVALVKARGFILPPTYIRSAVTDEASLVTELSKIKQRGFGLSFEEMVQGIATVAVAIRERNSGRAVGAVSVSGPAFRLTEARALEIAPVVMDAAKELAEIWPLPRDGGVAPEIKA